MLRGAMGKNKQTYIKVVYKGRSKKFRKRGPVTRIIWAYESKCQMNIKQDKTTCVYEV